MGKMQRVQNNFTSGELDPLLHNRTDLKQFLNGAESLRNCIVLPQGGFRRRPGTRYIAEQHKKLTRITGQTITAPNGGTTAQANDNDLTTLFTTVTEIQSLNPYVVVHYDLGAAQTVLFADCVELRNIVNTIAPAEFFIQYSTDDVTWTNLGAGFACGTAEGVTRRRTGPVTARYWRIARIGTTDFDVAVVWIAEFSLWTEGAVISESEIVDFEFSTTQKYVLLFTDHNAQVFTVEDGAVIYQCDLRTTFTSAQIAAGINWTQSLDTLIVVQQDVKPMRFQRQGADTEWHTEPLRFERQNKAVPQYAYTIVRTTTAVTLTPSATTGSITATASAGVFTAGHVNQYVDGNLGRARITEYVSATVVKALVVIPFFNTTAIPAVSWTLETGYEDVWSDARGWPTATIFYQNRLVLAGGKSLPNSLAMSRVGDYFNFDAGQALDDDPLFVIIQADDVPAIHQLKADRNLQIFTSSAEYYVPQDSGTALTPRNISVRRTTARGIKAGLRPVNVSGATIFLQRGGKAFREFVYKFDENAFTANNLSLLSSHLVIDPVSMCLRKSTSTDEADLVIAVNSDGTLAVCVTMRDQEVNAWSPHDTQGLFLRCGAVDTAAFFVVERTIDGVTRRYFETFDSDLYVDCGFTFGAGTVLTGLDPLEGETIKVRADDAMLGDEEVSGGQVTIDRAAVTDVQVGFDFTPVAITLPAFSETQTGVELDGKKRISRIMLDLFETQNLLVQEQRVNFRAFGLAGAGSPLDAAPPIYTGRKVIDGLLGWSDENQVTITQDEPAPMTVRALEYQLRV